MEFSSLASWNAESTALALYVDARRAKEWFGKRWQVPAGVVALLPAEHAPERIPQGRELTTVAELILVKEEDFPISFLIPALQSKEEFSLTAGVTMILYVDTANVDSLQNFYRQCLQGKFHLLQEELFSHLYPEVESAMRTFCVGYSIEDLGSGDLLEPLARYLRSGLKRCFQQTGLELVRLKGFSIDCPAYEQLRQKHFAAKLVAEHVQIDLQQARSRQRLREIWEKDQKGEALSQQEVMDFCQALAHEGYLKHLHREEEKSLAERELALLQTEYDKEVKETQQALAHVLEKAQLEQQLELDQRRLEHDLEQSRKVLQALQGADLKALISQISDEAVRADLYRALIEKEMTPEQIKERAASDFSQVNRRLEEMFEKLLLVVETALVDHPLVAAVPAAATAPACGRELHRVLVAAGKRIFSFDPKSNYEPQKPRETYALADRPLGNIRSVRYLESDGRTGIAVGAMYGVYWIDGTTIAEFPFPWKAHGRGGTNAVALDQKYLYATHSEHGLVCWDLATGQARQLHPELTQGQETIRAVQIVGQRLYFAAGKTIYALALAALDQPPTATYCGSAASITALTLCQDTLYAGNEDGDLLSWFLSDPVSPSRLLKKAHPLYMVRQGKLDGHPHLLIGCKEAGVLTHAIVEHLERIYAGESPIRWAEGDLDFIFGVDARGNNLFCWRSQWPETPYRSIAISETITDLALITLKTQEPTAVV